MTAHLTIGARRRTVIGKRVRMLRRKGILPANIYGHNVASQALEIDGHEFQLLQRHLSSSSIIDLKIDGSGATPVMIHRTQREYRTGRPSHVEFFQINMTERLTASVPLVLIDQSDAVLRGDGVLLIQDLDTIEVTCLPGDLPTQIEVSVANLQEPGDVIHVRDLHVDRDKIEVRNSEDDRVVGLAAAQLQVEEEVSPAAEEAVEGESAGSEEGTEGGE